MADFGWSYPPGFNSALLDEPDCCQHGIHFDENCRQCEGAWDGNGCEHGHPYPEFDDHDVDQFETGYDPDYNPNPNCQECQEEAEHNLRAYGVPRPSWSHSPPAYIQGAYLFSG